ncbi:MgtC/SapB family protein [Sporichthya brevicatena]|uniref:MgtC/SapB family protein n=1 Tax=Sporichthya brevicatena TaxID=171442 RepID=A0ABN1GCF5_9ACTN
MNAALATASAAGHGQGMRQVGELLLAFGLSSLIGLERQLRGKAAGLRTQTIVGTTAALMLLVSKYGFGDVLPDEHVSFDPSRVAAQIVSGVGFLGAGLILTRQGAVQGLTTAASVWETAGIGMAAGAGLPLLACLVTLLHFVVVFGYTALSRQLPGSRSTIVHLTVRYTDGQGVLRRVLENATAAGWTVRRLSHAQPSTDENSRSWVSVTLALGGRGNDQDLFARVADVPGVGSVTRELAEDLD